MVKHFIIGCAVGLLLTLASATQAAVTEPRGIYVVKVPGSETAGAPARTYLGVPLLPDRTFQGEVTSVTGRSFEPRLLNSPSGTPKAGRSCYVHVLSGAGEGFVADIEAFRETDILCTQDLDAWMTPGTTILIRPHRTLSGVFGDSNRFGFQAGESAEEADNVVVWDPVAQSEKAYYFHATRGRWERRGAAADAGDALIRFPLGCYIVRRSPGTIWMTLSGEIGSETVLFPVRPGANVFSLPINLNSSLEAWFTISGDFAVDSAPNASRADLLTFHEPATGERRGPFYLSSGEGLEGWLEVGIDDSDRAEQRLDPLSALVLRHSAKAGYIQARANLSPEGPAPPLPDAEPGAPQLTGEFPLREDLPSDVTATVEISTDLRNWSPQAPGNREGDKITFPLPTGESHAFYRLRVEITP